MTDQVQARVDDGIATLTLNAPERLNAVDPVMLDALTAHLGELDSRPDVRVIALTGAGRGFCSGADLTDPAEESTPSGATPSGATPSGATPSGATPAGAGEATVATLLAAGTAVRALTASGTPVVALVNGVAAGVGVSLALACDYVLATQSASFVLAFTKVGLMPDGGATALVTAAVGRARALRLALTAERVSAETAAQWGLIAECCPDEVFVTRGAALLAAMRAAPPLAMARTIEAINAASLDLDAALSVEESGQTALLATLDAHEGIAAFRDRRPPQFRGH